MLSERTMAKDTKIKKVVAHMESASDEERQGIQDIMRYYDESNEAERRDLLHFIRVRPSLLTSSLLLLCWK